MINEVEGEKGGGGRRPPPPRKVSQEKEEGSFAGKLLLPPPPPLLQGCSMYAVQWLVCVSLPLLCYITHSQLFAL